MIIKLVHRSHAVGDLSGVAICRIFPKVDDLQYAFFKQVLFMSFLVSTANFMGKQRVFESLVLNLHDGAFIMNVGALSLKNRDFGIWWPSHQIPCSSAPRQRGF